MVAVHFIGELPPVSEAGELPPGADTYVTGYDTGGSAVASVNVNRLIAPMWPSS